MNIPVRFGGMVNGHGCVIVVLGAVSGQQRYPSHTALQYTLSAAHSSVSNIHTLIYYDVLQFSCVRHIRLNIPLIFSTWQAGARPRGRCDMRSCMITGHISLTTTKHFCCIRRYCTIGRWSLISSLVRPPGTLVPKAFCFSRDVFFNPP